MGLGGINITQLLIILLIVILIFGTKRLKSIGSDLGGALKSFRGAMDSDDEKEKKSAASDEGTKQIGSGGEPDAEFSEQAEKEQRQ